MKIVLAPERLGRPAHGRRVQAVPGVTRCQVVIQDHFIATEIAALVNDDCADDGSGPAAAGSVA